MSATDIAVAIAIDGMVGVVGLGDTPVALAGNGLQALLGALFVVTGGTKLVGVDQQVESFERWDYPQWFRVVTGLVEVSGGIALAGGLFMTGLTVAGAVLLLGTMLGAVYTHAIRVGDPMSETVKPALLLVLVLIATLVP